MTGLCRAPGPAPAAAGTAGEEKEERCGNPSNKYKARSKNYNQERGQTNLTDHRTPLESASTKRSRKGLAGKRFIVVLAAILALYGVLPSLALASGAEPSPEAAYYRLVSDIVHHYGVHQDPELYDSGLAYAELIDFDGNGVPELYIIYATHVTETYGGFIQEIWTYRNGNVHKVYEDEDGELGLIGDRAVALSSAQGKSYLVYSSSYSSGLGDYPYTNNSFSSDKFLTLVDNQMVEAASALYVWEEHEETGEVRRTYTITENGKERQASREEYRNLLQKYGGDARKEIVASSAGDKSFAFDMTNNEGKIRAFLESLAGNMRSKDLTANQWPQWSLNEKNELTSFLFNFAGLGNIDLRHYTDAEVIRYIKNGAFHGTLDQALASKLQPIGNPVEREVKNREGSYMWFFDRYSAAAYREAAQALFGVSLEKKSNDFAYYEPDYFYLPEYAFGGNPETVFPRVQGVYALGDGLYYAEFDLYGAFSGDVDHKVYRNAYETLPERAQEAAYRTGSGYALLHKTAESPYGWQLIAFDNSGVLPGDQMLNAFKEAWPTRNDPDSWAIPEVKAAVQANLVPEHLQGWYGSPITRAEFSRLIMNFLTVKTGKTTDQLLGEHGRTINPWAFEDTDDGMVLAVNALGIVSGKGDGIFDPDGLISRQEAAVMLTNAAKLVGLKASGPAQKFADESQIAAWAREAVKFVSAAEDRTNGAKIMSGVANNQFGPTATFTRQQAIITVKRLLNTNG